MNRCSSSAVRSSRQGLAPTPTGSSTTGRPSLAASLPHSMQTWNFSSSGVPVFKTVAALAAVTSAISSGAWAIMGLAPAARARLAQSLAVTMLLTQWTRGRCRRTASKRVKSIIRDPL